MNELSKFFAQGDADLRAMAGEDGELVRRDTGERLRVVAVVSPLEAAYTLQRATGPLLECDRMAVISRGECAREPKCGDLLAVGGQVYEIVRVTGWAYDTSWHVDLALRKGKKAK